VWLFRSQTGITLRAESQPIVERHLSRALALDPQLVSALALEASDIVWGQWKLEAGAAVGPDDRRKDPLESGDRFGKLQAVKGDPVVSTRRCHRITFQDCSLTPHRGTGSG
jgi:hypothetical protein